MLFLFILLFGCAGIAACWAGVSGLVRYQRKLARAHRAVGKVVELLEETPDAEGTTFYRPRVHFSPSSGSPVEFDARTSTTRSKHRPGDEVEVFYDPADPTNADIPGARTYYVLLIVLGSPFLATALALLLWGSRGR